MEERVRESLLYKTETESKSSRISLLNIILILEGILLIICISFLIIIARYLNTVGFNLPFPTIIVRSIPLFFLIIIIPLSFIAILSTYLHIFHKYSYQSKTMFLIRTSSNLSYITIFITLLTSESWTPSSIIILALPLYCLISQYWLKFVLLVSNTSYIEIPSRIYAVLSGIFLLQITWLYVYLKNKKRLN